MTPRRESPGEMLDLGMPQAKMQRSPLQKKPRTCPGAQKGQTPGRQRAFHGIFGIRSGSVGLESNPWRAESGAKSGLSVPKASSHPWPYQTFPTPKTFSICPWCVAPSRASPGSTRSRKSGDAKHSCRWKGAKMGAS